MITMFSFEAAYLCETREEEKEVLSYYQEPPGDKIWKYYYRRDGFPNGHVLITVFKKVGEVKGGEEK